jgi:hypothetical protein
MRWITVLPFTSKVSKHDRQESNPVTFSCGVLLAASSGTSTWR